ncbi:TIGR01459 family HAD-type hydrolase [Enterovirga sp.]|uniref:TIGR01459 family HAD-type hydrolase n=1 Tax=Enterovirga sp. TaxID=2026350 RepID=UPI00262EF488|nr:TIGR01459 family HAD-type hydrolase [Enterovirga sp.]MDB5592565.1 family hydrolase [Enterovirga sp.]
MSHQTVEEPGHTAAILSRPGPEGRAVTFVDGLEEVAARYDLLLCDVWGVLHDGVSAFRAAGDALARYRQGGGRVVLVSNAPRPGADVVAQLAALGVRRDAFDDIRTSGDLTRDLVAGRGAERFHHIGPERDLGLFDGLPARACPLDEADYVVCTGLFDDETETVADYADALRAMRARGLLMVCANPDIVVERGDRLIICAGALAAAYEEMGGQSVTAGKPHRPIYQAALELGATLLGRPADLARVLGVGDAIRTDVAGGHGAGIDTLLVARGIHAADLGLTETGLDRDVAQAWMARQDVVPTFATRELVWAAADPSRTG